MNQDYTTPAFKKLLKRLQEESWQLELLISGFAIFGLITAFPNIKESAAEAQYNQEIFKYIIFLVAFIACAILIFNLLLHVLLRGLWIGTLGLRYVSGDIDYEALNYSPKFTNYLKKKVGSFDKYIAKLENYCSIIFAISFLLIFYVLSLTFTIAAIALIAINIIDNDSLPNWISYGVGISLIIFIIIGMFICFMDFITQGFLKKKKWLSKIYFPIYFVFSFITLSFLYRPLVYNFLDNKFGKRLSFILVPIYFLIFLSTSLQYNKSNYLSADANSSEIIANGSNYIDIVESNNEFIDVAAIQSKVITDKFIKVFVVFSDNVENNVFDFNKGLKPDEDIRGLDSGIRFGSHINGSERDSLRLEYVKTFNKIYSIAIDSTDYKSDFIISKSKKNKLGFETYISTDSITKGKHLLKINRLRLRKNDTSKWSVARIPFWYY